MLVFIYESSFVSVNLAGQYNNKKSPTYKCRAYKLMML